MSNERPIFIPSSESAMGDAAAPEAQDLVKDLTALAEVARRLRDDEDMLMLRNKTDDLTIIMRCHVDDDTEPANQDLIDVEIGIFLGTREDDEAASLRATAAMECDGFIDEDGDDSTFTVDHLPLNLAAPSKTTLQAIADRLNVVHAWRRCGCKKYLIKKASRATCNHCLLRSTPRQLCSGYCPICMDHSAKLHLKTLPCCAGLVHADCFSSWTATGAASCPCCRNPILQSFPLQAATVGVCDV